MCILLSSLSNNGDHLNYPLLFLWLFIISLPIISTKGTFPHIKIETKLSTLEDITIGVLALILCIVLSFAGYFLYLRVSINQRQTTINEYNRSTRDYSQSRLVSIKDENNDHIINDESETTALLLKRGKSASNQCDGDDTNNREELSSYISFGAYGAVEDKDSEHM